MICTVYGSKQGMVLVPDCMRPPREAEEHFGPLRTCGSVDVDRLDPMVAKRVERALDQRSYAALRADLALRVSYSPLASLPLPEHFAWRESTWVHGHGASLLCGNAQQAVAAVTSVPKGGWLATTDRHKAWAFRGCRVSASYPGAIQYLALWAERNSERLLAETRGRVHAVAPPASSSVGTTLRQRASAS